MATRGVTVKMYCRVCKAFAHTVRQVSLNYWVCCTCGGEVEPESHINPDVARQESSAHGGRLTYIAERVRK